MWRRFLDYEHEHRCAEHEHDEESRTMSCNGDRDPHAFDGKDNRAIPMTADE